MKRLTILDGYTLNPGDLSWEPLRALCECSIYDYTAPDELLPRSSEAELLLTNKISLTSELISRLPVLRYIGVLATGYNVVDIEAARKRGIPVTNVPAYGTESVAQTVFAHLLNLTHGVGHHAQTVRSGRWSASRDFCYWDQPLIELAGLTLGIVGLGRIGSAVARLGRAFGMKVIAHDPGHAPDDAVRMVPLDELFRLSDVVSLHCPLTPATNGLVNAALLELMKPTAFLINTSRGALIDEIALAEALNAGKIGGAGLDVLSVEPPPREHPLLQARNCSITPHMAWATLAARQRLLDVATQNVKAFLQGKPVNVVNMD